MVEELEGKIKNFFHDPQKYSLSVVETILDVFNDAKKLNDNGPISGVVRSLEVLKEAVKSSQNEKNNKK